VGNGGLQHRTRLQQGDADRQVMASMAACAIFSYLHSFQSRMAYDMLKYVANSDSSSLHDRQLRYSDPARWVPSSPPYPRGENLGDSININIIDLPVT
jgi:hypothetical protein